MTHVHLHPRYGRGPAAALASAWNALCCLWATGAWLWLARAASFEPAAPAVLVLLDLLSVLLDAAGTGGVAHG